MSLNPSKTIYVNPDSAANWAAYLLGRQDVPTVSARTTSSLLVAADCRGTFSHGLAGPSGLESVLQCLREGSLHPHAEPRVVPPEERKYRAIAHIDGGCGLGPVAAVAAVKEVKKLAREFGVSKVYVYNASHFGSAGLYSEMIADEGDLAGRVTCTTRPWAKPYIRGGNPHLVRRVLGTNPIAWSTPWSGGIVTIDMSTTQRAANVALQVAESCDQGFDGRASISMLDYLSKPDGSSLAEITSIGQVRECSIQFLGGAEYGYKGFGLATSIELDSVLAPRRVEKFPDCCEPMQGAICQIFEAWAIDSFYCRDEVQSRLDRIISNLKSSGGDQMRVPGEIERENSTRSQANGICYPPAQLARLIGIGRSSGVPFPLPSPIRLECRS